MASSAHMPRGRKSRNSPYRPRLEELESRLAPSVDLSQYFVTVSPPKIASGGTAIVTLSGNNAVSDAGSVVVFCPSAGTASGTFSNQNDNGGDFSRATFTGTAAGTNTITATIDGCTRHFHPTNHYRHPSAHPSQSTVTVSSTSVATGSTMTVTSTARMPREIRRRRLNFYLRAGERHWQRHFQ